MSVEVQPPERRPFRGSDATWQDGTKTYRWASRREKKKFCFETNTFSSWHVHSDNTINTQIVSSEEEGDEDDEGDEVVEEEKRWWWRQRGRWSRRSEQRRTGRRRWDGVWPVVYLWLLIHILPVSKVIMQIKSGWNDGLINYYLD